MKETNPANKDRVLDLKPVKGVRPDIRVSASRTQTTFRELQIPHLDPMIDDRDNAPGDGQGKDQPGESASQLYPGDAEAMDFFRERKTRESATTARVLTAGIPFSKLRTE